MMFWRKAWESDSAKEKTLGPGGQAQSWVSARGGRARVVWGQPRPRRLLDNSLRTCAPRSDARQAERSEARRKPGGSNPGRAGGGSAGGLLKGPAPQGPVRRPGLLMVRAGGPREWGSRRQRRSRAV